MVGFVFQIIRRNIFCYMATCLALFTFSIGCAKKSNSHDRIVESIRTHAGDTLASDSPASVSINDKENSAVVTPENNIAPESQKTAESDPKLIENNESVASAKKVVASVDVASEKIAEANGLNDKESKKSSIDAKISNHRTTNAAKPSLVNVSSSTVLDSKVKSNSATAPKVISASDSRRKKLLLCLKKSYPGAFEISKYEDEIYFKDGTKFIWDDGKVKSFEQKIEDPDLEDMFSISYVIGPIKKAPAKNDDPGRIRVERFFKKLFGESEAEMKSTLRQMPLWKGLSGPIHFSNRFGALQAVSRVSQKLDKLLKQKPEYKMYLTGKIGGTAVWRTIAGTDRLSNHSFGTAIDIVTKYSNYLKWDLDAGKSYRYVNRIPYEIAKIFEDEKFIWGAKWYHYDTMHFEFRPELFCK